MTTQEFREYSDSRKGKYFKNKQEVWDLKRCKKESNHLGKDGMDTPHPFKGACPYMKSGVVRYNGGCTRGNPAEWYEGEEFFLPLLHEDYEWIQVPSWYWRIVLKNRDRSMPYTTGWEEIEEKNKQDRKGKA